MTSQAPRSLALCSWLSPRPRSRRLVSSLLATLAGAVLVAGCAAEAEEQEGPQFPSALQAPPGRTERPVGTAGIPPEQLAAAEAPTYPEPSDPPGRPTIIIGSDGAVPSDAFSGDGPVADEYADSDPSALTDFHGALDPYGSWVEDPTYGTIWQPSAAVVGADFAPYETGGHWSYGDDYVWVSDYSWGWAPFHYGRWIYATNGWGWIPGRQYAGAWTSWRTGYGAYGGYVGWAPLPPTWYWRGGQAVGIGIVPPAPYAFCRSGDLFASSLGGRMVTGPTAASIGPHSSPVVGVSTRGVGSSYGGGGAGSTGPFAGRTAANPAVLGPSPASLHVAGQAVTPVPRNNAGLNHAAQFSHPSTAVALGAHAPAGWSGSRTASASSSPYGRTATGASAYGHYNGAARGQARTLGGGGYDRSYVGGHAMSSFRGGAGAYYGGSHAAYGYGAHNSFAHPGTAFHGAGVHGGAAPAAAQSQPYYGEGAPHGSSGGGHWGGGHGGGGGGHGGGHR